MSRTHISAAALIVRELNARLQGPPALSFSEPVINEIGRLVEKHVAEALVYLRLDDVDTALAVKHAVTMALYVKLEDLLVSLDKAEVRLEEV